jgi:hypothetical protein
MNQLKKVTTGIGSTCLAGNDSGSGADTRGTVAMLLATQAGGLV